MKKINLKFNYSQLILAGYIVVGISALAGFYHISIFLYQKAYLVITAPEKIKIDHSGIKMPDINLEDFNAVLKKINDKNNLKNLKNIKNIF
jgi:hypothetical protein